MADRKLTPKQEAFVREYLVSLNATDAARKAGYSVRNADKIGHELLGKTGVAFAIAAAKAERASRTLVTADRVVLELARVAFSDPRALYRPDGTLKPPCEWDDDVAAAVSGVETDESVVQYGESATLTTRTHRVKRWDKIAALARLMPHVGLKDDPPPAPGVSITVVGGIDLAAIVGARPGLHTDRITHSNGDGHANGD